jgi:hypothetical protein
MLVCPKATFTKRMSLEPVQKSVTFAQALAVSQAKALRNMHFLEIAVAKLKFCNSLLKKSIQKSLEKSIVTP